MATFYELKKVRKEKTVSTQVVYYEEELVEIKFRHLRTKYVWVNDSKDKPITIDKMSDIHIRNAINHINNSGKLSTLYKEISYSNWRDIFKEEQKFRQLYSSHIEYQERYMV